MSCPVGTWNHSSLPDYPHQCCYFSLWCCSVLESIHWDSVIVFFLLFRVPCGQLQLREKSSISLSSSPLLAGLQQGLYQRPPDRGAMHWNMISTLPVGWGCTSFWKNYHFGDSLIILFKSSSSQNCIQQGTSLSNGINFYLNCSFSLPRNFQDTVLLV